MEKISHYKKSAQSRKVLFRTSIRLRRYITELLGRQFRSREAVSGSSAKHWLNNRGQITFPALTTTVNGEPHLAVINSRGGLVRQQFIRLRGTYD